MKLKLALPLLLSYIFFSCSSNASNYDKEQDALTKQNYVAAPIENVLLAQNSPSHTQSAKCPPSRNKYLSLEMDVNWCNLSNEQKAIQIEKILPIAGRGDVQAQYELCEMYQAQSLNLAKAYGWCKRAAEKGHARAQYDMGMLHLRSNNLHAPSNKSFGGLKLARSSRENIELANKWFSHSADQGIGDAMMVIAQQYQLTSNDPKQQKEAFDLYKKASERGRFFDLSLRYWFYSDLAWMYENGKGTQRDIVQAYVWYYLANFQHNRMEMPARNIVLKKLSSSQFEEASAQIIHWIEQHPEIDPDIAYLESAANGGDHMAQAKLGQIYYRGIGVPKNPTEAAKWFEHAVASKNGEVQLILGNMHNEGVGVQRDDIQALKWWILSSTRGFRSATERQAKIEKTMSLEQVETAKRLAQEWTKNHSN